jgi:hypothetical protein
VNRDFWRFWVGEPARLVMIRPSMWFGTMLGGVAIERTGDVRLVYAAIGIATFLIPLYFRLFSPLGHAERYLGAAEPSVQPLAADRA